MRKIGLGVSLFLYFISAQAAILTFEPPPCTVCAYQKTYYEENNVSLSGSFGHYGMGVSGLAMNNSSGALDFAHQDFARIRLTNRSPFTLSSVDLGEYSTVFTNLQVTFRGFTTDFTTVEQSFYLDGLIADAGGNSDFQSFLFPVTFSNLLYADITTYGFSMDNLQLFESSSPVSPVPLPGAFWLFLTGLSGLMFRKKTAS